MERWAGRCAIVTGAGSGIGEAVARLLAEKGLRVLAVDLDAAKVQVVSAASAAQQIKGEIRSLQVDVTAEEDVARAVQVARESLGGADVLVNCAGMCYQIPTTDLLSQQMRKMLDTNVLGLSLFTREFIKDVRARGVDDAHVIHISSVSGQRIPDMPGLYFYSATKHAVKVLTEGLRRELRDLGTKIRVTGVSPGVVRTNLMLSGGMSPEAVEQYMSQFPVLEPRDVAEAVVFALAAPPHVQVHEVTILPTGG